MSAVRPPQEDIDLALLVERRARDGGDWGLYMACLNGKPMSQRHTDLELRAGCVFTNAVYVYVNYSALKDRASSRPAFQQGDRLFRASSTTARLSPGLTPSPPPEDASSCAFFRLTDTLFTVFPFGNASAWT